MRLKQELKNKINKIKKNADDKYFFKTFYYNYKGNERIIKLIELYKNESELKKTILLYEQWHFKKIIKDQFSIAIKYSSLEALNSIGMQYLTGMSYEGGYSFQWLYNRLTELGIDKEDKIYIIKFLSKEFYFMIFRYNFKIDNCLNSLLKYEGKDWICIINTKESKERLFNILDEKD